MLFGTRARNVFGRNTNPYAIAAEHSIRQVNPTYASVSSPAASSQSAPSGYLPATFFDTPPSAFARRWYQLLQQGSGGLLLPLISGGTNYAAILFTRSGAEQRYVVVSMRPAGAGRIEAKYIADLPESFDPDAPQGTPWDPFEPTGPDEWIPATFFNAPPTAMTRRWVKLTAPVPGSSPPMLPPGTSPGVSAPLYDGILYKNFGAQQESVTVRVRTVPQPGGGSKVEANLALGPGPWGEPGPGSFPGVPPGSPIPNPDPWGRPIVLRRRSIGAPRTANPPVPQYYPHFRAPRRASGPSDLGLTIVPHVQPKKSCYVISFDDGRKYRCCGKTCQDITTIDPFSNQPLGLLSNS